VPGAEKLLHPGDMDVSLIPCWSWPGPPPGEEYNLYCEEGYAPVVTISFDNDPGPPVTPATDTLETVYYTVRWSSGNFGTQIADIDAQKGAMISIPADTISITASYPIIQGRTHPTIKVRASLGFNGSRGSLGITNSARRTVRIPPIPDPNAPLAPATISAIQAIPRMAVSAVMRNSDPLVSTLNFVQLRANDPNNISSAAPIGKLDRDSVPVANGSLFFSVGNAGADPSPNTAVIFYLAL